MKQKTKQSAGLGNSTSAQQIKVLESLTQMAAAWMVSLTARTLRDNSDIPRAANGRYDARDLVKWFHEFSAGKRGADGDPLLGVDSTASPALERYREERAAMARLDRLERERSLIPREDIHAALVCLAVILRGAGERLGRDFGPAAAKVMNEALHAFEAEIKSNDNLSQGGQD